MYLREELWLRSYAHFTDTSLPQPSDEVVTWHSIPHVDHWDKAWLSRAADWTVLDLCAFHKQYVVALALLYPKADTYGETSSEHKELVELHDRYTCFLQRVMDLVSPEVWESRRVIQ